MDIDLLQSELKRFEGCRSIVYRDTKNLPTAGIGHLMLERDLATYPVGSSVPYTQIQTWFQRDIQRSICLAQQIISNYQQLDDCRQRVCVSLTFNMGNRLYGFHNFIMAMHNEDFVTAANELRNSIWYQEVGDQKGERGYETALAMEKGFYPSSVKPLDL